MASLVTRTPPYRSRTRDNVGYHGLIWRSSRDVALAGKKAGTTQFFSRY